MVSHVKDIHKILYFCVFVILVKFCGINHLVTSLETFLLLLFGKDHFQTCGLRDNKKVGQTLQVTEAFVLQVA